MVINWFKTELYLVILLSLAKTMFFVLLKKQPTTFIAYPNLFLPVFSASKWKTIHPDAVKTFLISHLYENPLILPSKQQKSPIFLPLLLFPFQSKPPITISFIRPILTVLSTLSTICQQSTFHTAARVKAFRASTTSNHSTAFNG